MRCVLKIPVALVLLVLLVPLFVYNLLRGEETP